MPAIKEGIEMKPSILASACSLALAVCGAAAAAPPVDPIASATSAAPASIGRGATVMGLDMKVLRKGTNGWTCFPDDPNTPANDPMCFDRNGLAWMDALMAHKPPPKGKVGLSYMLQGASDASNLDPFATKPPPGAKWVMTGPHLMILSASVAAASGYPTKEASPDTSRPYVMFGGTPYAHIMAPVR
jgi:hypothetical protein